jgi:hypothetical protein
MLFLFHQIKSSVSLYDLFLILQSFLCHQLHGVPLISNWQYSKDHFYNVLVHMILSTLNRIMVKIKYIHNKVYLFSVPICSSNQVLNDNTQRTSLSTILSTTVWSVLDGNSIKRPVLTSK